MFHGVCSLAGQGGFQGQGVRGLKMLGCRDLTYRLVFLACVAQVPCLHHYTHVLFASLPQKLSVVKHHVA